MTAFGLDRLQTRFCGMEGYRQQLLVQRHSTPGQQIFKDILSTTCSSSGAHFSRMHSGFDRTSISAILRFWVSTYPKEYRMVKIMVELIEVAPQIVLLYRLALWHVFMVSREEGAGYSSENASNSKAADA
jgi:hypothetical protein